MKTVILRVPEYIEGESSYNCRLYLQQTKDLRRKYTELGYKVRSEVDEIKKFDPEVTYTVKVHFEK